MNVKIPPSLHVSVDQAMELCERPIAVSGVSHSSRQIHIRIPGLCSIFLHEDDALDLAENLTDCVGEIQREVAQC